MDVKEPTAYALDYLYERIVPSGLIILYDYNNNHGKTYAIDGFSAKHKPRIEKTSYYCWPS